MQCTVSFTLEIGILLLMWQIFAAAEANRAIDDEMLMDAVQVRILNSLLWSASQ